jgi:glycosyltransferase involved in cell wall biosynthesis
LAKTVLFVVDGLGLSGKTRTMVYLATHLDRDRFAPVVCTLSDERTILVDQLEQSGVPVHTLPVRDGVDFGTAVRLGRVIRSTRASIVHCYNPRPILYGGLAAMFVRVRGTIGFLSAFACQVPDRTYGFLPEPLRTSSRRNVYRNRIAAHTMRYLVTVSAALGKRFCEYNALSLDKLRVVPYGADLSAVERVRPDEVATLRRELACGPNDVLVGSVGRLVEQKDYPTQLKAFALAAAQFPQLRMVLAGDGPLGPSLRALVEQLGIGDRVRFLGHWERVPCLLRSLDVFVLSSKFEPFGVALLEAKAAALPIVSTSVNEIPEIITDGVSGLLCPAESPERMAQLFVTLATDASLRERLGRAARDEASERHSLEASVRAYHSLYESCLN